MKLRREAPTPLYLQLKNALVADIDAGQYKPHERLMSERELGEKFKVSRMTVRQALTEMIREGFLYTQVGKGTYVSEFQDQTGTTNADWFHSGYGGAWYCRIRACAGGAYRSGNTDAVRDLLGSYEHGVCTAFTLTPFG